MADQEEPERPQGSVESDTTLQEDTTETDDPDYDPAEDDDLTEADEMLLARLLRNHEEEIEDQDTDDNEGSHTLPTLIHQTKQ